MMNLIWNPENIYDENNEENTNVNEQNSSENNAPWNAKNIYE